MLRLIPNAISLRCLKPHVSATCQHGCSQNCKPQNTLFEVIKISFGGHVRHNIRFEDVVAGSLPNRGKQTCSVFRCTCVFSLDRNRLRKVFSISRS